MKEDHVEQEGQHQNTWTSLGDFGKFLEEIILELRSEEDQE